MSITLAQVQSDGSTIRTLDAESNPYAKRKVDNKAKGNAIHVGGEYTNQSGSQSVTGSLGCFTLCGKDSGNSGNRKFKKDIENRRAKNRKAKKGTTINVIVDKRQNKDVVLKANVNKNGKATKYLETQR